MKTKDGKVEEAGCAPLRWHVRKKHKRGDAGVDRVGDRRSWAILEQNFSVDSWKKPP
jgi:hypothetical protein